MISDLRLDGDLRDRLTNQVAVSARTSQAYTGDGHVVPSDVPRFEPIAISGGYEWDLRHRERGLRPIAIAGGTLFATDSTCLILASTDGETFTPVGFAGNCPASAYGTPGGALLVATFNGDVWRSGDGGATFALVLTCASGYVQIWGWATLGEAVFASEYGGFDTLDNPRRVYRSLDDGQTWECVFEPPGQTGYHNHKLVADPWTGCVYQAHGDTTQSIWVSCDGCETWQELHDYYAPTAAVVRADAIYWGRDGNAVPAVQRYDKATGHWTFPLTITDSRANIFAMTEYDGILYAHFNYANQLWASADGMQWTLLRAFDPDELGLRCCVGAYAGWVHSDYYPAQGPREYLRFRPGKVRTTMGLRIESAAENLLATPEASSAEGGCEGWEGQGDTIVAWDSSIAYHGESSVRVQQGEDGYPEVKAPVLSQSQPAGTELHAQIRIRGDERQLIAFLYDEAGHQWGPPVSADACDEWRTVRCKITADGNNAIRLVLHAALAQNSPMTIWLDGYQITRTCTGGTWQLGGDARAGEVLRYAIPLPAQWTDCLWFCPDFGSDDTFAQPRTLKAWVQDADNYIKLVFDSSGRQFKLVARDHGNTRELCATDEVRFSAGWAIRCAVFFAKGMSGLHVRIAGQDNEAAGAPLNLAPTEIWIGSSPAANDQAPGVYALSRTFSSILTAEECARELEFVPPN